MAEIITLAVGQMAANCYLVYDPHTSEAIVVDPGDDAEYISDTIIKLKLTPKRIVATHGHFDHIMACYALKLHFGIPLYLHAGDAFLVENMQESAKHFLALPYVDPAPAIDKSLKDGDVMHVGTMFLTVMHTPGHTPGSVCLYEEKAGQLFCGDTIFSDGAVGRTDRSYARAEDLKTSIARILTLPDATRLFPGHGADTSVKKEKMFHLERIGV